MRIVHLLASPWFTGPAELVAQLASAQRALGHEVSVCVDAKRSAVASEELARPRFEALGLLGDVGLELSVKSSPVAVLRDAMRLRGASCDVVHAHFSHDHVVARFGRPAGAALVRSIHAPRSLTALTPAADGWTVPVVGLARRLVGQRVVVLPPLVGDDFRPPEDRPAVRRALGLEEAPTVGMVSTFQPSRRHALGLEAFASLRRRRPDARLLLVGDGVLEPRLRQQVAELQLGESVRFAGYQPAAGFARWLQAMDEVWVLGLGNDFAGRAAAQARACGARVVTVDEGALSRFADVVVAAEASALAEAALGESRRTVVLESPAEVADRKSVV